MSFTENDRIFRSESGKTFPALPGASSSYLLSICAGLNRDFGGAPAAVKTVARLVGANERAVRNWFEGKNGPSGAHLIVLMRHSPAVLEAVLSLAGRADLVQARLVADAAERIRRILAMVLELTPR